MRGVTVVVIAGVFAVLAVAAFLGFGYFGGSSADLALETRG